jgi:phage terminase small subunit
VVKKTKPKIKENTTKKKPELTDKQRLFCLYYIQNFNATMAYQKAFQCSYDVAHANSYRMMANDGIKREIRRLKSEKKKSIMLSKDDILERYMRIAFADMTDFVEWGRIKVPVIGQFGPVTINNPETGKKEPLMQEVNNIRFKESDIVDGGLVCQIKQGRDGASIKLEDRQKALEWLANYFEMNPMNKHKKEYDNKKLDMELRKIGQEDNQELDDGFLEALNAEAGKVWDDVEED